VGAATALIRSHLQAVVNGAWIVVVALCRGSGDAGPGFAKIAVGASILVVTWDV